MAKMWAAFFLSILLVSTLNFYAVVREPDRIEISEIHEHLSETVKIKGTLISWVRDPYSDGSDRVDLQVEDDADVVKVRWYDTTDVPPIGTTITVEGEVVQYNGKIWINSKGMGAIFVEPGADYTPMPVNLTGISHDPSIYEGKSISITGYIGDALQPNITYQSFYLQDNPNYIDADHTLYVQVQGRVDGWHEAGTKVNVTGWVQFDERSYRWHLVSHATTIEILVEAGAKRLNWAFTAESWSYDIGKLVIVPGTPTQDDEGWWIIAPSGAAVGRICLMPSSTHLADENFTLSSIEITGRLIWSEGRAQICLDATAASASGEGETDPGGVISGQFTLLSAITADPLGWDGKDVFVQGWTTGSISPDYDKGYLGDGPDYFSRSTTIRFQLPGPRGEWIEKAAYLNMSAVVMWEADEGRLVLHVNQTYNVGSAIPPAEDFAWGGGWDDWTWQVGVRVNVAGIANQSDSALWLVQSGNSADNTTMPRICLDDTLGTALQIQGNSTTPMIWTGRLMSVGNSAAPGVGLCLLLT